MSKELVLAIQNRLANVTELKYIDNDWGQLDTYSPNPPAKFPCALIDIANVLYANIGVDPSATPRNRQTATGEIAITIADVKLTNTSKAAPTRQQQTGLKVFDCIERVHQELHGWKPLQNAGALIRLRASRVKRDDGIQEYLVIYSFSSTNV